MTKDQQPSQNDVERVAQGVIDRTIERLRDLHDYAPRPAWDQVVAEELCAAITALHSTSEGRVEQMREALKPFAEACDDCIDRDEPADASTWEHSVGLNVTIGDYRRARAALGGSNE